MVFALCAHVAKRLPGNPLRHIAALLLLFLSIPAFAGEATLAWDPSPDPRVAGYNVYVGQSSGSYAWKFDAGGATTYTATSLSEGNTYYFAVTANDGTGEESVFSNEVSKSITYTAPTTDFSANVVGGIAPLEVRFSSTSAGTVTTYYWNFGDGGTSTQQNPSHTYVAAGTYSVTLTVSGPGGEGTKTKTTYINVSAPAPVASFTGSPTSGIAPLTVAFSNSSSNATSYRWDFGNGATSTSPNPTYTFPAAGTYAISLTATGPGGSNVQTKSGYVVVTAPPNQAPEGTIIKPTAPLTIAEGQTVAFEAFGSDPDNNTPLTYTWDFGEGATNAASQKPTVAFSKSGTFTVRLTVTDSRGLADSSPASTTITVTPPPNQPPNGTITAPAGALTIAAGQTVAFQASGVDPDNNTPLSYEWNFGGVAPSSNSQNPTVMFSNAGTFTVMLTVRDAKELADPTPASIVISVTAPASPTLGLVAAYGFNEGTGSTAADASGMGNSGILTATNWVRKGRFGKALKFNGTSSIVRIKDSSALRMASGMTIEAWVKPSATRNYRTDIVRKGADDYYLTGSLPSNGVPAGGVASIDGRAEAPGTTSLPVGTWTHVAVTYDRATVRFYVNGNQVSSKAWSAPIGASSTPLEVGGDSGYASRFFYGVIDELRIYGRALSANEIRADMTTAVR